MANERRKEISVKSSSKQTNHATLKKTEYFGSFILFLLDEQNKAKIIFRTSLYLTTLMTNLSTRQIPADDSVLIH